MPKTTQAKSRKAGQLWSDGGKTVKRRKAREGVYIYHKYGNEIVVDVADHTDHIEQHYKGDPKWTRGYICGVNEPLTPAEVAAFEKQYGMKVNTNARPKLAQWTPPVVKPRAPYAIRQKSGAAQGVK